MENTPQVNHAEENIVSLAEKRKEAFGIASATLLEKMADSIQTSREAHDVHAYIKETETLVREAEELANQASENDYFGEEAYRLLAELLRAKLHTLKCALDLLHLSQNNPEARKVIVQLFPSLLVEIDEVETRSASTPRVKKTLPKAA